MWNAAVRSVRDDLVPLRRVDLQERPDLRPSGVVDEAVDPAEPLDHALDQPFGLRAVGEVGVEGGAVGAGGPDPGQRRLSRVAAAAVVDRDRGALGGRLDGHLGADPAAAAGDEHDPTRQRARHQRAPTAASSWRSTTGSTGGGAVDPRITSSVGRTSAAGSPPASSRSA